MKKFTAIFTILTVLAFGSVLASAEYVLSGNDFLKEDKELYSPITVKDTGADYVYTDDSDNSIKSTDTKFDGQELLSGRVTRDGGDYVVNCTWSSSASVGDATAIFDLKDIYAVNRIDVWSMSSFKDQLGKIKIEVSSNGIDYTEVGTYDAVVPEGVEDNVLSDGTTKYTPSNTVCNFKEVSARYVKVTTKKASVTAAGKTCYKYILGEVVIIGDNVAYAEEIEYFDMYGEKAGYLEDTDYVEVKTQAGGRESILVTARFGAGKELKQIYTDSHERAENYSLSNKVYSSEFESGDYLKSFVIDSFDKLKPLGEANTFEPRKAVSETALLTASELCDSYELMSEDNEDISKLFDGDASEVMSLNGDIKIHFSELIQIDKLNVTEKRSSSAYLNGVDMYVSTDGINYVLSRQLGISGGTSGRMKTSSIEPQAAVYATDIKLVFKKNTENADLAEVEVFGKTPQFKRERQTNYVYDKEMPFATNEDIINADSDCTLLNLGESSVTSAGDYVSLIYDLQKTSCVETIIAEGEYSGGEISYSIDGYEYYTSAFFPKGNGKNEIKGKNNARYIKIVFSKGDLEKIALKEVKVFTRAIYDEEAEKNQAPEAVFVKTYLKENNILSLDWSEYNEAQNNVIGYRVYIEETNFLDASAKTPKAVYVGGESSATASVTGQYCKYSVLEPDKDYWVAVVPLTKVSKNSKVTPVKIHTFSAIGGETLAGMFNIGEYPQGGSVYETHTVENCGFDENENFNKKLSLINSMGTFQRTKYWSPTDAHYNSYISNGMGINTRLNSAESAESTIKTANSYGTYCFAGINEPDLSASKYFFTENAEESEKQEKTEAYLDYLKSVSDVLNEKSVLCAPSTCGTEKLYWYEELYKTAQEKGINFNDMYDVVDVHAYCKKVISDDENKLGETELDCVPEHLTAKVEKIRSMLKKYGDDDKDIIFTELGWSTHTDTTSPDKETVTREQQAYFTVRAYLTASLLGVKNVYLYSFQDGGAEDDNPEKQFGMVDWYGVPKPAYYAYYTLSRILKNASNPERIESVEHPVYGAYYYDNEKDMYLTALWTADGKNRSCTLQTADTSVLKTDMYGNSEYIQPKEIQIGSAPIYIYTSEKPSGVSL